MLYACKFQTVLQAIKAIKGTHMTNVKKNQNKTLTADVCIMKINRKQIRLIETIVNHLIYTVSSIGTDT